jgi:DNA-binding PadR family transcriptional regulator
MHGYELARLVQEDQALHTIWRIERSEVYFLLGKLRQKAYIVEYAEERLNGPARTIYAPTEAGRLQFFQWLRTPETKPRNLRTALLARVYMALRHDPSIAVDLLDAQKRVLDEWLLREGQKAGADDVVALVHRLRTAQVRAMLEALDDLRALALTRWRASTERTNV